MTALRTYAVLRSTTTEVTSDEELIKCIPAGTDVVELQKLMTYMENLESVNKCLQKKSTNILQVLVLFEGLFNMYPTMSSHLAPNAEIVHSPSFETGIIKIMNNQSMSMPDEEKNQTSLFAQPIEMEVTEVSSRSDFASNLLQISDAMTMKKTSLEWISPTFNIVERLNSSAKFIYCPQRKSMSPYHLECVLFLKTNKTYWDASMCSHL